MTNKVEHLEMVQLEQHGQKQMVNIQISKAYTNLKRVVPYYISDSEFAIYKTGYSFEGWYTAPTGGY